MDLKNLTEEQTQIVKNVINDIKDKNLINEDGKKSRKIKISKKDLQLAFFMKDEIELGKAFGTASDEDISLMLNSLSGANNAEEIAKLKIEKEELKARSAEISKKIIALKAYKGPKIELI